MNSANRKIMPTVPNLKVSVASNLSRSHLCQLGVSETTVNIAVPLCCVIAYLRSATRFSRVTMLMSLVCG